MPSRNETVRRKFKRDEVAWVARQLGVDRATAFRVMRRAWLGAAEAFGWERANGLGFRVETTERRHRTSVVVSVTSAVRGWSGRDHNHNRVSRRVYRAGDTHAPTFDGQRNINAVGNGVEYRRGPARVAR